MIHMSKKRNRSGVVFFSVSGSALTKLVRDMMAEGRCLRALRLLFEGLHGMTWPTAFAILEGRMRLEGEGKTVQAVPDDTKGLLTFDEAVKREEENTTDRLYGREARKFIQEGGQDAPFRRNAETPEGLLSRARLEALAKGVEWLAVQEMDLSNPRADALLQAETGYLLPDGKLYPCPYYGHIKLADALGKSQEEAEREGWIKLQKGNWYETEDGKLTQAQFDTITDWCRRKKRRIPDWVKEAEIR